jgi:hypothetical protein
MVQRSKFCILIYGFSTILTINSSYFPNSINHVICVLPVEGTEFVNVIYMKSKLQTVEVLGMNPFTVTKTTVLLYEEVCVLCFVN